MTDSEGLILVCSDESLLQKEDLQARDMIREEQQFVIGTEGCYKRVTDSYGTMYACFLSGTDDLAQSCLHLFAGWMEELLRDGRSELTRETLLRNILLENELPGNVPLKAQEYRIVYAVRRVALVVQLQEPSLVSLESIRSVLPGRSDFVFAMDDHHFVILFEVQGDPHQEAEQLARSILQVVDEEGSQGVLIGVGMPVEHLQDCSKSYREASLALTVGRIFDPENTVVHYNRLGLGRLIYQLPSTLCRMFLEEVFPNRAYEELDAETLESIEEFFRNNLNGSETARQLFVHRNTLVYRLDKVMKITNLDLRNFDDAVLFKLAAMVRRYLEQEDADRKSLLPRWWTN